jgi:hypothetical protein
MNGMTEPPAALADATPMATALMLPGYAVYDVAKRAVEQFTYILYQHRHQPPSDARSQIGLICRVAGVVQGALIRRPGPLAC